MTQLLTIFESLPKEGPRQDKIHTPNSMRTTNRNLREASYNFGRTNNRGDLLSEKKFLQFLQYFFELRRNADVSYYLIEYTKNLVEKYNEKYEKKDAHKLLQDLKDELGKVHTQNCRRWLEYYVTKPVPKLDKSTKKLIDDITLQGLKESKPQLTCSEIDKLLTDYREIKNDEVEKHLDFYKKVMHTHLPFLRYISKELLEVKGIHIEG
jgi:hypothetical protein